MQLVKLGKTKDVYMGDDGNIVLRFKDTVTGGEDGAKDPGGNLVVGTVAGVGSSALRMTTYYFEKLKAQKIKTHYVGSDLAKNEMTVRPAKMFGSGLEFVVRYRAAGSFIRRFGAYIKDGAPLDALYEITLKDDARNDPPATEEIVAALGLMSAEQLTATRELVLNVCQFVREDLAAKGLELIDIKVEVGLVDGQIALIDEISGGNMRVYKDGKQLDYNTLSASID